MNALEKLLSCEICWQEVEEKDVRKALLEFSNELDKEAWERFDERGHETNEENIIFLEGFAKGLRFASSKIRKVVRE